MVLRAFKPVLTLRTNNEAHTSLTSPHSLLVNRRVWATSPLVVAVRCIFWFFLSCFDALWDSKVPHWHACEGFLLSCNLSSFMTPSPEWVSVPNLFCIYFYLLYFVLPLLKRLDFLSRWLVSSARIQKLFCGSFSTFTWSFDEFVGEKVASLSYSSTILGPCSHHLM